MKKQYYIAFFLLLLLSLSCHKESEDEFWKINPDIFTYILEYDSQMRVIKYSELKNDMIIRYQRFEYSDGLMIHRRYNGDSDDYFMQKFYVLDSQNRVIKSYPYISVNPMDTVYYSYTAQGFLNEMSFPDGNTVNYWNDGTDIVGMNFDELIEEYQISEKESIVKLPISHRNSPLIAEVFGKGYGHLIRSYNNWIAGPGGSSHEYFIEYSFNTDRYVTELRRFEKVYYRYAPPPEHGTLTYCKMEYVFH